MLLLHAGQLGLGGEGIKPVGIDESRGRVVVMGEYYDVFGELVNRGERGMGVKGAFGDGEGMGGGEDAEVWVRVLGKGGGDEVEVVGRQDVDGADDYEAAGGGRFGDGVFEVEGAWFEEGCEGAFGGLGEG